jgi:hypothetical protein
MQILLGEIETQFFEFALRTFTQPLQASGSINSQRGWYDGRSRRNGNTPRLRGDSTLDRFYAVKISLDNS